MMWLHKYAAGHLPPIHGAKGSFASGEVASHQGEQVAGFKERVHIDGEVATVWEISLLCEVAVGKQDGIGCFWGLYADGEAVGGCGGRG